MRRIIVAVGTTATGLVLLFSWPTSWNRPVAAGGQTAALGGAGTSQGTTATGASSSGSGSIAQGTATVDGAVVQTPYGNVQVRLTVTDGNVTAAEAIAYPDRGGTDVQISNYAIPILSQEAVQAQSAKIDMVSGATFTSRGYIQSLQDALDQANL